MTIRIILVSYTLIVSAHTYLCLCSYTYVHTYLHSYIHAYIHDTCIHTSYIPTYVRTYIHTWAIYTSYIHMSTYTCAHTRLCACAHTYIMHEYTCMYSFVYIDTVHNEYMHACLRIHVSTTQVVTYIHNNT